MNSPIGPWLYCECEDSSLHGNREAYQLLRTKIDELLKSADNSVVIQEKEVAIGLLVLRDYRDLQELPRPLLQKLFEWLLFFIILSIPASILLLAVFGLIQLIHIFS